ncbi:hypothetical protein [Galbibacter mesophilus]|nr:hypothetical protein [Galbibacter mesophilus]MCM5663627.1 hypothetical protein [Galbibacter mesophilus]
MEKTVKSVAKGKKSTLAKGVNKPSRNGAGAVGQVQQLELEKIMVDPD